MHTIQNIPNLNIVNILTIHFIQYATFSILILDGIALYVRFLSTCEKLVIFTYVANFVVVVVVVCVVLSCVFFFYLFALYSHLNLFPLTDPKHRR